MKIGNLQLEKQKLYFNVQLTLRLKTSQKMMIYI